MADAISRIGFADLVCRLRSWQAERPVRLDAFRGLWSVARTIEDGRNPRTGRFDGWAIFEPAPEGLAYLEKGTLVLGEECFPASRRYLWCDGGAGAIEVRFPDGRLFHRFLADEERPAAVHDCHPDRYRVRYDFRLWPRWRAEWQARGPAKHYGIVSEYRPAGQAGQTTA